MGESPRDWDPTPWLRASLNAHDEATIIYSPRNVHSSVRPPGQAGQLRGARESHTPRPGAATKREEKAGLDMLPS